MRLPMLGDCCEGDPRLAYVDPATEVDAAPGVPDAAAYVVAPVDAAACTVPDAPCGEAASGMVACC